MGRKGGWREKERRGIEGVMDEGGGRERRRGRGDGGREGVG